MKAIICAHCEDILQDSGYVDICHIKDLETRVHPGEIVPHGECRACGHLVYQHQLCIETLQRIAVDKILPTCVTDDYIIITEDEAQPDQVELGVWCNVRLFIPNRAAVEAVV